MAKWTIPRHKPKSPAAWTRENKNRNKPWKDKRARSVARLEKARHVETAFLDLVTRQGDKDKARTATMMIGQCVRKARLSEARARQFCRSAAVEKGCVFHVYRCKWCGSYHLTSHPEPDGEYVYSFDGSPLKKGGRA